VAASLVGDVSFTSVFVTSPTHSGTDPDGPITVTIGAWDDGALVGTQQVALADGTSQTVPLPFDSVDTLKLSAAGKHFGIDDLTGLPVGAVVVPASTHENRAGELMLEHLTRQSVTEDTPNSATGWLQVACIATTLRHLSRAAARWQAVALAA
jgi:hypothetical protein